MWRGRETLNDVPGGQSLRAAYRFRRGYLLETLWMWKPARQPVVLSTVTAYLYHFSPRPWLSVGVYPLTLLIVDC